MRRRALNRAARWGGVIVSVLMGAVYLANVPFYAGSGLGSHYVWRMEHGRIALSRSAGGSRETFYVAINNEGMRFRPDWRIESLSVWEVNLPLWVPFIIAIGVTAWAWRVWARDRRKRRRGLCRGCRYNLAGLPLCAPCPECGLEATATPQSREG